jgi:hypothetical protein
MSQKRKEFVGSEAGGEVGKIRKKITNNCAERISNID